MYGGRDLPSQGRVLRLLSWLDLLRLYVLVLCGTSGSSTGGYLVCRFLFAVGSGRVFACSCGSRSTWPPFPSGSMFWPPPFLSVLPYIDPLRGSTRVAPRGSHRVLGELGNLLCQLPLPRDITPSRMRVALSCREGEAGFKSYSNGFASVDEFMRPRRV